MAKFCICFDTDKLLLLPVSFLQLVTYGPWVMPIRIPFPLDIVRTNGWNFTQLYICIYIGKIFDGILPFGFHKFVTELWSLWLIFLQHEMQFSAAIVRFSEFNITEACWKSCSHFMCIVKRVADSWTLFGDSFKQKWISIENGSFKLTHSLFIAPFKNNIHSPWVGIRPFWSGSSLFCMRKPCILASLWALDTQRKPSAHNRCPRHADLRIRFVYMVFLILLYRCGSVYLNILSKQYPIWSTRILFSYSIVPFSKGPYFWENMYKFGKFLIWLVGYFPDQKFYWGKGLLYEENRLFLGPYIDNLGSVIIIRGGGILYYTPGKFTQNSELHQRQNNSKKIRKLHHLVPWNQQRNNKKWNLKRRVYNSFLVYCRELAPGTVSLTGDRAQGDDNKHDSHYSDLCDIWTDKRFLLFILFTL